MAGQRVIVFTMHEGEQDLARRTLAEAEQTPGFTVGEASDEQVEHMRAAGLIVQPIEVKPGAAGKAQTPGRLNRILADLERTITFASHSVRLPEDDLNFDEPQVYLIQIIGPLLPQYRERLREAGAELLECYVGGGYSAFLSLADVPRVARLEFVSSVDLYEPADTVVSEAAGGQPLGGPEAVTGAREMVTWDIRLHRESDKSELTSWLENRGVAIAGEAGRKVRIYCLEGDPKVGEIASLAQVQKIEQYISPKLFNDRACALVGLTRQGVAAFRQDGTGQIVAVADTGLDESHPDFAGRTVAVVALGRPGNPDDPHGHGTHVSGTVLGTGAASGGQIRGAAPGARLYFQSLLDAQGKLGGLPLNLGDLFESAYQAGARVHNNSWGAATRSTYTINSDEADAFVAARRDMLVVFAAGNEGQAAERLNSAQGIVDWLSIGAPGTAKNVLTVGASSGDRTSGGLADRTWGDVWPSAFPDPVVSTLNISGNDQEMAGFSSRGPSDDRRIKPDIVAPGTDILSARSSKAPAHRFWGSYPANDRYAYMGGTSMAAPLVAGCAALVRQYFIEERGHEPSAALVRATLINGATWLSGATANASNQDGVTPPGNFDQGFGRLNMATTIPAESGFDLAFIDNWQDPAEQLNFSGDRRRFIIEAQGSGPLRLCLAYTDWAGRGLQNNLNLFLQLPDGSKRVGNHQLRNSMGLPDGDNNVEVIRIDDAPAGSYLVQITAANLLHTPQDFALVVTGNIRNTLTRIG
jgi:hypothetical protein